MKTIGVLALQGAFREHLHAIKRTGNYSLEVRKVEQLDHIDGLIIPGGESTAISKLMVKYGFIESLKNFKKPVFGTCAGAILLAKKVPNLKDPALELMDITVDRNAYGRQVDSFEEDLDINFAPGTVLKTSIDDVEINKKGVTIKHESEGQLRPFHCIFIRAPKITEVGENVDILASFNEEPVLVREGNYLAATFHPELTEDYSVHRYFIEEIIEAKDKGRKKNVTL